MITSQQTKTREHLAAFRFSGIDSKLRDDALDLLARMSAVREADVASMTPNERRPDDPPGFFINAVAYSIRAWQGSLHFRVKAGVVLNCNHLLWALKSNGQTLESGEWVRAFMHPESFASAIEAWGQSAHAVGHRQPIEPHGPDTAYNTEARLRLLNFRFGDTAKTIREEAIELYDLTMAVRDEQAVAGLWKGALYFRVGSTVLCVSYRGWSMQGHEAPRGFWNDDPEAFLSAVEAWCAP